jgi:SAM-dependent methyltransferase
MKLSRLITYKHMVDNLHVKHVYDEIQELLTHVVTDLNIQDIDFDDVKAVIQQDSQEILNKLDSIEHSLAEFKNKLNEFVDGVKTPYYARSMEIYQEGLKDTADYLLDRHNFKKLLYQDETRDFFISRVKSHNSWKWPALQIRPASGEITDAITGCDPLYLADTDSEMFKQVQTLWTPEYQKRVRYCQIDEQGKRIYHRFPAMQMGMIVAVDFFNFRPLEIIKRHLGEMFTLLRPGGVAIFTYNNCDYPIGVDNFENSYYCYTPGEEIKELCRGMGFKIVSSFDLENNVSWLEIQRPGTRTSLRGGQTLGRIQVI